MSVISWAPMRLPLQRSRVHESGRAENGTAFADQLGIGFPLYEPHGVVFSENRIAFEPDRQRPAIVKFFIQAIEHRLRFFDVGIGINNHCRLLR